MKLTDVIVSALLKKGILYEARNCDITVDVPIETDEKKDNIKISFKAEHMSIRIDKEA